MGQVACPDWHEDSAQGFSPDLYIQVDFSGEAASYDSLGLSEQPASAGSAALGNEELMSLALKARKKSESQFSVWRTRQNITAAFEPRLQR